MGSRIEAKVNKPQLVHHSCEKKEGWHTLWLDQFRTLLQFECVVNTLKLLWNKKHKTYSDNLGVLTRIPYSHGSTKSIEFIDDKIKLPELELPKLPDDVKLPINLPELVKNLRRLDFSNVMKTLVDGLVAAGGKRNISIRAFPYDWRRVPSSAFLTGLTSLVKRTYNDNNKTPVTLLSYSASCKYVLWFLNNKGEKYLLV